MRTRNSLLIVVAALGLASACSSPEPTLTVPLFDLDGVDDDLFALPYPNDIRRRPDGTIAMARMTSGYPELVQQYLDLIGTGRFGFSTNGAVFFRFSGPLDTSSLPPTSDASKTAGSAVQLINIDPKSPDYGKRVPLRWQFERTGRRYIGDYNLSLLPLPGFTLRPATVYAAVVTDALLDAQGLPVTANQRFTALLGSEAPEGDAHAYKAMAPLRAYLAESGLTGVTVATVFTTGGPYDMVSRIRRVVHRMDPPAAFDMTVARESSRYIEIRGSYKAPFFQKGTLPFFRPEDGGDIAVDAAGDPKVVRMETMRFALTIPKGKMPDGGWPIVLYAHGTGGSYRTFINNGTAWALSRVEENGNLVTQAAVIGIDQSLHGPRAPKGTDPSLAFINVVNAIASINAVIHGAADNFALLRLAKNLSFRELPATKGRRWDFGYRVRIDGKRVAFMGHSQGGLTGPLFLAAAPDVGAGVISAGGANSVLSFLNKTAPVDIPALLRLILKEPINEFHPMGTMLQQLLEASDPANQAAKLVREPPPGFKPKHLLVSQGFVDHYTPNATTDALAIALAIPQMGEMVRPVKGLEARVPGTVHQALPAAGNITVGSHSVTAGLLQYRSPETGKTCDSDGKCRGSSYCGADNRCYEDGHFVVFDVDRAKRQVGLFIGTYFRDGIPRLAQ